MDKEKSKNIEIDLKLSFGIGAMIGAVIFVFIYGFSVLDISNDDWLLSHEFDLTQHYQGWRLYRNSGWHFPIGLCDTSLYPYLSSVVYTDSIPLFAFFFKLISPILPDKFQYFGLFGLISFMLQGGIAKVLLYKTVKKEWIRNVGAVFFVTNIVFVHRMFWQTALSSHFLILMAMALFLYRNDIKSLRKRVILWTLLGALSVSIHFYLYGMISVMLGAFALLESIDLDIDKKIKRVGVFSFYLLSYVSVSVLVFYIFGGFYGTIKTVEDQSSIYMASIISLFYPMGKSLFFSSGEFDDTELEGFGYLGVAVCILLVFGLIGLAKEIKALWVTKKKDVIIVILLVLFFYLFSVSPIVTLNGKYLFNINVFPGSIYKISWGLFRACGRFIWPVMYLITLLSVTYSDRILKRVYPYVLVAAMCLQIVEFGGYFRDTNKKFDSYEYLPCPADVFTQYDISQYEHIQFMQPFDWYDYYSSLDCYYEFVGYSRLAADKGMTISNFHFSRDYADITEKQINSSYDKLNSGTPDSDTLYVFPKETYINNGYQGKFKNVIEFDTGYDIVLIPEG